MKKKLLALSLCLGMVATSMVGCGKDSGKEEETTKKVTKADFVIEREDYVGLEVEESVATVTDEELQKYIDEDLKANSTTEELKEGVLESGMVAKIDYTGTVDGKEYAKQEGSQLELSKDKFAIEGFVEGLIGKSVGDEVTLDLKFPKDYTDEKYAGKDIKFVVKIKAIVKTNTPKLTDDYVKEVYSYLGISTVDEYKEEYRKTIRAQAVYSVVWPMITKNIEIKSYDSVELEKLTTEIAEMQEYNLSQYGMTLDKYLEAMSMSKADFTKQCEESAKEELQYNMIRDYIAEKENITISDEEYNVELKKTMVAYDIETEEEFYKYFEEMGYDKEFFKKNFLMNKVVDFIVDNIKVVPDKEKETETTAEKK